MIDGMKILQAREISTTNISDELKEIKKLNIS